jgi:hypothetical protein
MIWMWCYDCGGEHSPGLPHNGPKTPPQWDEEIRRIEKHAAHFATAHKATATMAVAVDDERKRDYFVPRLQKIIDNNTWAAHLTFRVVPVNGSAPIEVNCTPAPPSPEEEG